MYRGQRLAPGPVTPPLLSAYDEGLLHGLLIGEGHFGGDQRIPQIAVRMHIRHIRVFSWLARRVPGSLVYGPYTQWPGVVSVDGTGSLPARGADPIARATTLGGD